jgi:16S rRNA (guanine1207-N2)-methyltransferase
MERKNQHYYSPLPDVNLKIHTVSESLRRRLYVFKTIPGIFSYKKLDLGTKILIENMNIPLKEGNFLDLGCGYGPIGIVLAREALKGHVYLIDINKHACWCTRENIKINVRDYKGRTHVFSGSFFEPIKEKNIKFNGIYMNPPLRLGRKIFFKICKDVFNNLSPEGSFQFVLRKKMGAEHVYNSLKEKYAGEKIELICKRSGYWVFNCFFND